MPVATMSPRRNAGIAGLGALLAVLAWVGWGVATSDDSSAQPTPPVAALPALDEGVATRPTPPTPARAAAQAVSGSDVGRLAAPPAPAVLPDGFETRNGMLTAVRSAARADVAPSLAQPGTAVLPAGIRPEDAVVSPSGIVTVMRTDVASRADDVAANALRPATMAHSP
jgi:hypothetical protein